MRRGKHLRKDMIKSKYGEDGMAMPALTLVELGGGGVMKYKKFVAKTRGQSAHKGGRW